MEGNSETVFSYFEFGLIILFGSAAKAKAKPAKIWLLIFFVRSTLLRQPP